MNTCKTIDYKISIYPTIVPSPSGIVLSARIILPDCNALIVQQMISREKLKYYGDKMAKEVAQNFADEISRELSIRLVREATEEIDKQM